MNINKEKYYGGLSDVLFYKADNIFINIETLIPKEDLVYFISYNYLNYPNNYVNHFLMYQLKSQWQSLYFKDWQKIIDILIENESSTIAFITFFYTNFEINMLVEAEKVSFEKKVHINNIKSFYQKGFIKTQLDKYLLNEYEKYGIAKEYLLEIQNDLLNQGAIKAITIEPDVISLDI